MNDPKISVIVLVYKVENYIERCARSLFEQTQQHVEFIFVNDCTPDCSIEILQDVMEKYPERKSYIRIIQHKENRGSGVARNTGLEAAKGEYIIYCDSDDWVEPDMYEKLYNKACEENADIVMCDYYEEVLNGKCVRCSQNPQDRDVIESILIGKLHSSACGALIRKSLYDDNHIRFPDGISMWEDLCTSVRLHFYARKVAYVNKPLHHYMFNATSLTHRNSIRNVKDRVYVALSIQDFLCARKVSDKYESSIACMMLNAKMCFLLDASLQDFNRWRSTIPKANRYIHSYTGSLYAKIIMYLVDKRCDGMARLVLSLRSTLKL